MQIDDLDPAYRAFVRDLLVRSGFDPDAFHLGVGPGDEMFFKGILPGYPGRSGAAFFRYVESALRSFAVYRQLVDHLGGFPALDRVLDFGSGWGRLTRALRHHLPREKIWACDIYPDAIAWQAETFGVNGLVSATDPDRFALPLGYSLVFAGSVFSHLPDGLFQRWLKRLCEVTGPRGLLAFSVHDAAYAPQDQTIGPQGIGFAEWSESSSLDPRIYGMSYVRRGYVESAIRDAAGPQARFAVFPRAIFENQDLYVVAGQEADVAGLQISALPLAGFAKPGGEDRGWSGWGVDPNPGHQIVRAELFVDDRHAETMVPTADNLEVAKFFPGALNTPVRWRFEPRAQDSEALLRVELTSSAGVTAFCYAQTSSTPGAELLRS
jgi:hypothetical protein